MMVIGWEGHPPATIYYYPCYLCLSVFICGSR